MLSQGRLMFHESCRDTIREFGLYRWNESSGRDAPVKENDHAMDDIRYFVTDMLSGSQDAVFAISVPR